LTKFFVIFFAAKIVQI